MFQYRLVNAKTEPSSSLAALESIETVSELADLFQLMADANRLRIILTVLEAERSVSDIAASLSLSQPLVSHHLRLLRAARILRSERRGRQIFYAAADDHIRCVIEDMLTHIDEPHHEDHV
ncbi:MAG: transcriptional regulator [Gammaproteobacteria bacterium]|nr:transcriptional regulator [Gammaproteobacteria bacterium]|tara:strand:- start:1376 stop:1738 length:363 start_codon:yes stop_codon:yes gene_type:complete